MSEAEDFNSLMADVAGRLSEGDAGAEYQFWEGPDVLEEIRTGEFPLGSIFSPDERSEMRELISGLIGLLVRRHFGDAVAHHQLNVIHSFTFPKKYEVPSQVVERLSKRYRSGHLIRAWEIRRLMYEISDLIVPMNPDAESILKSPIRLRSDADPGHPLYKLVSQRLGSLRRPTTLQMLAIHIYLLRAQESGVLGLNERTLKRDLQRLRRWEQEDEEHMRVKNQFAADESRTSWKAQIPIRKFSESWIPKASEGKKSRRKKPPKE
jgi:hypothetical protein